MRNIDTYRSTRQILEEIEVASTDPNPNHVILPFSVLLVKLSEQENAATRKLVRLTWALFLLILLLLLAVFPPLVLPWIKPVAHTLMTTVSSWFDTALDTVVKFCLNVVNIVSQAVSDLKSNWRN
jgi:nitrogen fixation/metabolism regulation signal transduction histidine kinase